MLNTPKMEIGTLAVSPMIAPAHGEKIVVTQTGAKANIP